MSVNHFQEDVKAANRNTKSSASDIDHPPDGGWGWLVCVACLVGNLINAAITLSFGVILPSLKLHFEEGTGVISFVGSLLSGLVLMTMPLAAICSNKFGLRLTYITGSLITSCALITSTISPNTPIFIVTFGLINGMGLGFISLVISVACNHFFTKRRALAVGLGKTGISLGSFIFPPLSDHILSSYGWKYVIYMYSGVALLSACFGCLIRPLHRSSAAPFKMNEDPYEQEKNNKNNEENDNLPSMLQCKSSNSKLLPTHIERVDNQSNVEQGTSLINENANYRMNHSSDSIVMKTSLKNKLDLKTWCSPQFTLFTASIVFSHFGWMLYFMFVPSMLIDTKHFSSTQASLVLTSTGITNTVSRILAGLIMDHPKINPTVFMSMGFVLCGVVLCILPFATHYASFIVLGVIYGLVTAPYNVGSAIVLGIMLPLEKVATAFGVLGFVQGGGVIIGPTMCGYIYDLTQDFSWIFVTAGILYIISGAFCWFSNYTYQRSIEANPNHKD